MTPFRSRRINGDCTGPETRFIRRLSFAIPFRGHTPRIRIPAWARKPGRGMKPGEQHGFVHRQARSYRRRLTQARKRPPAFDGTRCTTTR